MATSWSCACPLEVWHLIDFWKLPIHIHSFWYCYQLLDCVYKAFASHGWSNLPRTHSGELSNCWSLSWGLCTRKQLKNSCKASFVSLYPYPKFWIYVSPLYSVHVLRLFCLFVCLFVCLQLKTSFVMRSGNFNIIERTGSPLWKVVPRIC